MEALPHRAEEKAVHVKAVSTLGTPDQCQQGHGNNQAENPDDKDNSDGLIGL